MLCACFKHFHASVTKSNDNPDYVKTAIFIHQRNLFCLLLKCDKEVKFHYHTRHGKSGKKQSRSTVLTDGLVCFYQASQLFQIRTFDRPSVLWYDEITKVTEVFIMKEKMVKMKFTDFECNLLINGINEWRNQLLEADYPTEDVDALLLKIIDKAEGK